MIRRFVFGVLAVLALARPAAAQQRPLITQDPEPIGAGRILIEGGIEYSAAQQYPVSGLQGNLWRIPTFGVSIGISSIAEFQVDGGPFDRLTITGRADPFFSYLISYASTVSSMKCGTRTRPRFVS